MICSLYLFLNVNILFDALISSGSVFQRTLPLYINDRFIVVIFCMKTIIEKKKSKVYE